MIVTRFAPSPTGHLHLGHAYSALVNWTFAREQGGAFLLRIEDIDDGRCRSEFSEAILEDLAWLGLDWDGAVEIQSRRAHVYADALERLRRVGLIYGDSRTRAQLDAGVARPSVAALESAQRSGAPIAWRLDMARALAEVADLDWQEAGVGRVRADAAAHGDVILARKDAPASYHLAVTIDDAAQRVSHVIRGHDLYASTAVHRLLQELLGLPQPAYRHHELLVDDTTGRRFAKRDHSVTLRALRESGLSATDIRHRLGF
jgi:glutamyl-Q tRNA(Asp) synthetase